MVGRRAIGGGRGRAGHQTPSKVPIPTGQREREREGANPLPSSSLLAKNKENKKFTKRVGGYCCGGPPSSSFFVFFFPKRGENCPAKFLKRSQEDYY